MEMHHIRYFLAVCETLNFTRAAEKCQVTQPALSRAIQQLEDEVGGQLFRRERSATHLTDLGALLRPRLQQIAVHTEDARLAAQKVMSLQGASLTLGAMCTIGPARFTGCLAHFLSDHPGVNFKLVEGVPDELVDYLERGEIDVAVMAFPAGPVDRLEARPLYSERFVLAMPLGHRLAAAAAVRFADMGDEIYLERINCEYVGQLEAILDLNGARLKVCHESEREDWIQNMVAAGLGVSLMPEYTAVNPGIVVRPMAEPEVIRTVCLVTVPGRPLSPTVAAFVGAVLSYRWPDGARGFA